jgi:GntR family transcriptional regulator, galactonate operon transcriptional repressor
MDVLADMSLFNISQGIVDDLGRRIVRGEFIGSGRTLLEKNIMDEYGASRNAVREAVKTLAGKNIVRSERRVGTIVQPVEAWNLLDPMVLQWMLSAPAANASLLANLSELRMIIEPEAAALAASRATPRQVLRIYDCYDAMCEFASDPNAAVEHDVLFHEAVLDACGNPLLRSIGQSISLLLRSNFALAIQVDDAFIRNLLDHQYIADAIRDHDAERSRQAAMALLVKNRHDLQSLVSGNGETP